MKYRTNLVVLRFCEAIFKVEKALSDLECLCPGQALEREAGAIREAFKQRRHALEALQSQQHNDKLTDRRTKMNTETQELNGGSVERLVRRRNDLDSLREVYGLYRGEDMGANAVLSLCDEVDELRQHLAKIERVASGEDQVANDDTDGMAWIATYVRDATPNE